MRTMFTECVSCGTKFNWTLSEEDPKCERCQTIQGTDARKILALMSEVNIPGQKQLIHVLGLMLDRIEKIEIAAEVK